MYVKVRSMDGTQTAVLNISKITGVKEFRLLVQDKFDVPPERQRLFYRGKQMEDEYSIFDYNVNVNDVIQMIVKPILKELTNKTKEKGTKSKSAAAKKKVSYNKENVVGAETESSSTSAESLYYEEGDLVDAKCLYDGTWWEGKITKIAPNAKYNKKNEADDGLFYYVKFERYTDLPEDELKIEHIRPRARTKISIENLEPGDVVMVNYNFENPEDRGFWYDCEVTNIMNTRSQKTIVGTISICGKSPLEDCHISLVSEVFKIESDVPLTERRKVSSNSNQEEDALVERKSGPNCATCRDAPRRKCVDCGCCRCGGKESPEKQVMCDECDRPFHIFCLSPPLQAIPDVDEWFCPDCKNDDTEIVRAGEGLKASKKKAKLVSSQGDKGAKRDWGKGFACAGRQKVCTIVSHQHFGPIPGVEVGTLWKFRLQASEAGVHRPHVAGIHGRENDGAYSIVLAGGYEDDEDRGEEFTYTGSGGRDLSGNKRTAEQSSDQLLTRMNKALALTCNVPLNKAGAEAKDWRKGKPVRVVRNYKGRKHSEYAPEEGNRYDGIYKMVKYWPEVGKSGFKVWRYLLRRDDPSPAPWTKEGGKKAKELGLTLQYPEGYLEAMKEKEKNQATVNSTSSCEEEDEEEEEETKGGKKKKKKRGRKRKKQQDEEGSSSNSPALKKSKGSEYKLEKSLLQSIDKDTANAKGWAECKAVAAQDGKATFLTMVEEKFLCVCCQVLAYNPVSTPCSHNVCQTCLQRSFKAQVHTCPSCRHDLGKNFNLKANEHLKSALKFLFPGYEAGR